MILTGLFFLFASTMLAGNGGMVGKKFVYENNVMRQVLSFEDDKITVESIFDKACQKELLARESLPYFEFQVNKRTVSSEMPVWRFTGCRERRMANHGQEYIFCFEGKGVCKGLNLKLYRQYFPNSTLTREKMQLQSGGNKSFRLNKKDGRLYFVYPRMSFRRVAKDTVQEIQIANYRVRNHTFCPSYRYHTPAEGDELLLKGPFSITFTEHHKIMSAYEHASQDDASSFRLSEVTSKTKKNIDADQGVKGDETKMTDDSFWFIAHHYSQTSTRQTVATELRKGGYFDNEAIPRDSCYETVWNSFCFTGRGSEIEPLIHRYLFSQITEHPQSRKSHFYYNTWGMQRELSKKGEDLRGCFTEERILKEIDHAAQMNVDLFVLDDGWEEALGVWTPNKERLPDKLAPLIRRMKEHGMIPGIWLSPMAMDSLYERYHQHPEWIIRRSDGIPIVAQWGKPVFDIVGPFAGLFLEDCKRLVDQGIRFFKWDAMNTFNSSLSGLYHGDRSHTKQERIDRYNYLFPFYVTRIMKELREYNDEVVVEIDLTEPERCMIGLMPLQEGIFFFINNGASGYGDYSTFRTKSTRMVFNDYGRIFPKELFTYAVYPHDAAPHHAQRYNVNSTLVAGHGFWGDLSRLSSQERVRIGRSLAKAKRVWPYIQGVMTRYESKIGASPEIYAQIDTLHAFGQIIGFSGSKAEASYVTDLDCSRLLGILGHPYSSNVRSVCLDFHFDKPDDTVSAFLIGNENGNVSVVSSTGILDDIRLENNRLLIKTATASTLRVKHEDKKPVGIAGCSVLDRKADAMTIRADKDALISITFEDIHPVPSRP